MGRMGGMGGMGMGGMGMGGMGNKGSGKGGGGGGCGGGNKSGECKWCAMGECWGCPRAMGGGGKGGGKGGGFRNPNLSSVEASGVPEASPAEVDAFLAEHQ